MCITYVSAPMSSKVLGLEVSPIYLNELSEQIALETEEAACAGQKSLGEAGVAISAHLHMHLTAAESQQLLLLGDTT